MKSSVITFPGSNCDRDMDVAFYLTYRTYLDCMQSY